MPHTIENAKVLYEKPKSLLVTAPILDEPTWVPKSHVTDDSEVYKIGTTGDLIVTDWIAEKKGWLD